MHVLTLLRLQDMPWLVLETERAAITLYTQLGNAGIPHWPIALGISGSGPDAGHVLLVFEAKKASLIHLQAGKLSRAWIDDGLCMGKAAAKACLRAEQGAQLSKMTGTDVSEIQRPPTHRVLE